MSTPADSSTEVERIVALLIDGRRIPGLRLAIRMSVADQRVRHSVSVVFATEMSVA